MNNNSVAIFAPPVCPVAGTVGEEGMHTVLRGLCRQLKQQGHSVTLMLPSVDSVAIQRYPSMVYPVGPRIIQPESLNTLTLNKLTHKLSSVITPTLLGTDYCIAYDILFDAARLPLISAILEACKCTGCRLIFYSYECMTVFDWSAIQTEPWNLIAKATQIATLAFPTHSTRDKIAAISGLPLDDWHLLPPILDASSELGIDDRLLELWEKQSIWDADLVLFTPALNRANNNIEKALRIVQTLKARGTIVRLLLTLCRLNWLEQREPYFDNITQMVQDLELTDEVVFLTKAFPEWAHGLPKSSVRSVYRLCDAVLLPTVWEGFGLVAIESGLARVPLFCSDLPVLREITQNTGCFFGIGEDESLIADKLLMEQCKSHNRARTAALKYLRTDQYYPRYLRPMLSAAKNVF